MFLLFEAISKAARGSIVDASTLVGPKSIRVIRESPPRSAGLPLSAAVAVLAFVATSAVSAMPLILVPSQMSLQNAIDSVDDGGVIEIAAGTYSAPAGGFRIQDEGKGFTIRAATGATVTLDGGGTTEIVLFRNTSTATGGPVVFENLIFANGTTTTTSFGSGITLAAAEATFVGCTFRSNFGNPDNASAGAAHITNSVAYFDDCLFEENTGKNAGAGLALQKSTAWVHNSQFLRNRVNLPNHRDTAAGGAIHVGDSTLFLSNTRFEDNEAGYVGGAVFGIGDFDDAVPGFVTEMTVANCTFEGNIAQNDASVPITIPTEGGGFHAENQALGRIFYSRFYENQSDNGGAVNLYRATVEVEDSVFLGNEAVSTGLNEGLGGAFSAISNDTANATTDFGAINRPSATLSVSNCYVQGRYGAAGATANDGGALFSAGDNNRTYGAGGVPQMGTAAENRSQVTVAGTLFYDLDVPRDISDSGKGGALFLNLVDLDMSDSLLIDNNASGNAGNGQGGAMVGLNQSLIAVDGSTFAKNSGDAFGGGVMLQGSELQLTGSQLFQNEISPGVSEANPGGSPGAGIFSGPDDFRGTPVTGQVSGTTFADNIGLAAFEADRQDGPINDLRWNGNSFFEPTFDPTVFFNQLTGNASVSTLNSLTVVRSGAANTAKSQVDNIALGSSPSLGSLSVAPTKIVPVTAAGDAAGSTPIYLGWAWNGGSATLDGQGLGETCGVDSSPSVGTHTLNVDGQTFDADVLMGSAPAATFTATPSAIGEGGSTTLNWNVTSGAYIDMTIDQGVAFTPGSSGSVVVSPSLDTTYRLFVITKEGGVVVPVTVTISNEDPIFADGFESGNTSSWSSST